MDLPNAPSIPPDAATSWGARRGLQGEGEGVRAERCGRRASFPTLLRRGGKGGSGVEGGRSYPLCLGACPLARRPPAVRLRDAGCSRPLMTWIAVHTIFRCVLASVARASALRAVATFVVRRAPPGSGLRSGRPAPGGWAGRARRRDASPAPRFAGAHRVGFRARVPQMDGIVCGFRVQTRAWRGREEGRVRG